MNGRCLCGSIKFEVTLPLDAVVNCHCESCRRQTGAAMATFFGIADGKWNWTGAAPKVFASSPGVERSFCDTCGTPISYRAEAYADMMHFYVSALEDPGAFPPTLNVAFEEKLPWLKLADNLPHCIGPDYLHADVISSDG